MLLGEIEMKEGKAKGFFTPSAVDIMGVGGLPNASFIFWVDFSDFTYFIIEMLHFKVAYNISNTSYWNRRKAECFEITCYDWT